MSNPQEQQQGNNQQEENGKVEKRFQEVYKKLAIVVNGEKNLLPKTKVDAQEAFDLIGELFEEENKEIVAGVKTELKVILKAYVTLDRDFKEKEKALAKHKIDEKKKFSEAAEKLLKKIDDIPGLQALYASALQEGLGGEKIKVTIETDTPPQQEQQ